MASRIEVGDGTTNGAPVVTLSICEAESESVVIKNVAGSTLTYFNAVNTNTLTAGNSVTRTHPTSLVSAGRTSVLLTGGKY